MSAMLLQRGEVQDFEVSTISVFVCFNAVDVENATSKIRVHTIFRFANNYYFFSQYVDALNNIIILFCCSVVNH